MDTFLVIVFIGGIMAYFTLVPKPCIVHKAIRKGDGWVCEKCGVAL